MPKTEYEHFLYCPYCRAGQSMEDIEFETGIEHEIVCPKCLEEFTYETRLVFTAYKRKSDESEKDNEYRPAKITDEMKRYAQKHFEDVMAASDLGILEEYQNARLLNQSDIEDELQKRIEEHKAKKKAE